MMIPTYDKIICKIVNYDNNIFSPKYDKSDNIKPVNKFHFGIFLERKFHGYNSQIKLFYDTIHNFYFNSNEAERNEFISLYCKVQKTYNLLNRAVYKYKFRRAKIMADTDLQMNPIEINQPNVMCIYQNGFKYLFKIDELMKLIYVSLTGCYNFFCEPITIKNPYNNVPFGKSVLYNIYLYLMENVKIGYIKNAHMDLFLKFKDCNFNMTKFINTNEHILREYIFKNYITNSTKHEISRLIMEMIRTFNLKRVSIRNKITINSEFPTDELIRIMKPYLILYLDSIFSLIPTVKYESERLCYKKLNDFHSFNPNFGKKIIVLKDVYRNGKFIKTKSHMTFNNRHKKFHCNPCINFMKNHLSFVYNSDMHDGSETDGETDGNNQVIYPERNIISNTNGEYIYFYNNVQVISQNYIYEEESEDSSDVGTETVDLEVGEDEDGAEGEDEEWEEVREDQSLS